MRRRPAAAVAAARGPSRRTRASSVPRATRAEGAGRRGPAREGPDGRRGSSPGGSSRGSAPSRRARPAPRSRSTARGPGHGPCRRTRDGSRRWRRGPCRGPARPPAPSPGRRVEDDLHVVADEADGRDHDVRRPVRLLLRERFPDVRAEPFVGAVARVPALVDEPPAGGGPVQAGRHQAAGFAKLLHVGRLAGGGLREAVGGEEDRRAAPPLLGEPGPRLRDPLGQGGDEARVCCSRGGACRWPAAGGAPGPPGRGPRGTCGSRCRSRRRSSRTRRRARPRPPPIRRRVSGSRGRQLRLPQ